MRKIKYVLAVTVGLVALVAPRATRADDIVNVNMSGFSFDGNSVCGPSGTILCSETFSGSFQWDNTTNTYVAGSFSSTESGVLPSLSLAFGPGIDSAGLVEFDLADTNVDTIAIFFSEGASGLITGTYTAVTGEPAPAGSYLAELGCGFAPSTCDTDYPPHSGFLFSAVIDSTNGSVMVSSVPEPSSLILLGTGLLALGLLARRRVLAA